MFRKVLSYGFIAVLDQERLNQTVRLDVFRTEKIHFLQSSQHCNEGSIDESIGIIDGESIVGAIVKVSSEILECVRVGFGATGESVALGRRMQYPSEVVLAQVTAKFYSQPCNQWDERHIPQ